MRRTLKRRLIMIAAIGGFLATGSSYGPAKAHGFAGGCWVVCDHPSHGENGWFSATYYGPDHGRSWCEGSEKIHLRSYPSHRGHTSIVFE